MTDWLPVILLLLFFTSGNEAKASSKAPYIGNVARKSEEEIQFRDKRKTGKKGPQGLPDSP